MTVEDLHNKEGLADYVEKSEYLVDNAAEIIRHFVGEMTPEEMLDSLAREYSASVQRLAKGLGVEVEELLRAACRHMGYRLGSKLD